MREDRDKNNQKGKGHNATSVAFLFLPCSPNLHPVNGNYKKAEWGKGKQCKQPLCLASEGREQNVLTRWVVILTNQIQAQRREVASLQMDQDRLSTPVSLKAPSHSVSKSYALPISTNLSNAGHHIWIGMLGVSWPQTEIVTSDT